jgi:hypothetical protein
LTPSRRLIASLLLAALLSFACTDDGGNGGTEEQDSGVAPRVFMEDVCTAMSDWLADFLAGYQQVQSLDPDASVEQGKEALDRFLNEAIASTEELQQAVSDAGVPDVEGGDGFASGLLGALDQAATALEEARDRLAGLPNDPTQFRKAAIALGDTVRQQLGAAGDAIGENVPALQEAAANTPSCQSLGGTPGGPGN